MNTIIRNVFLMYLAISVISSILYANEKHIFLTNINQYFIENFCFSPDSKLIAAGNVDSDYGADHNGIDLKNFVTLWDVNNEKVIRKLDGHKDKISAICFSPDGKHIAAGIRDKSIKIWNVKDGKLVASLKKHYVDSIAFSPDGRYIVSAGDEISLWDINNIQHIRTFEKFSNSFSNSIAFSPDGKTIVSSCYNKDINLWSVKDGTLIKTFKDDVSSVCFSPDGQFIASGHLNGRVKLRQVDTGTIFKTLIDPINQKDQRSIIYSPDNRFIVSGDNEINIWSSYDWILIKKIKVSSYSLSSVHFSSDVNYLATNNYDWKIKLWNFKQGLLAKTFEGSYNSVFAVCFSPDGKYVAMANNNKIYLWDLNNGEVIRKFAGHTGNIEALNISPNSKYIVSADFDTIKCWNLKDASLLWSRWEMTSFIHTIFSPDSRYIVSGSYNEINIWDVKDGSIIWTFSKDTERLSSCCADPNWKYIAYANSNTVKLFNVRDNSIIKKYEGHSERVSCLSFSSDSKYLASGSWDKTLKLWDVQSGKLNKSFYNNDRVISVAFSNDNKYIVLGNEDASVKLWDVKKEKHIRTFKGHINPVSCVCFNQNGKYIASGSYDNTLRIWNTNDENDSYIFTTFSDDEWLSFKSGQLYYNSSPNGDSYAAIRFNNDTFNYAPLTEYRHLYKRNKIFSKLLENGSKINSVRVYCMFEGHRINVYDIDEDIKVFSNYSNKSIQLTYNKYRRVFTGDQLNFHNSFHIDSTIFKNQNYRLWKICYYFALILKFTKPVLYVLINPSNQLNINPLKSYAPNFDQFKNKFRNISNQLDGNKQDYWRNKWLRTYFYTQNKGHSPVLLSKQGIIATKWDDPDFIKQYNQKIYFQKQGISYQQLIDDACTFFDGFSISDDLNLKGASLFIIGAPDKKISLNALNALEKKLRNNKACAFIVQFGTGEQNYTANQQLFKYLKLIQFDMNKEFYQNFFQAAFEKIMKEFEDQIDKIENQK